MKVFVVLATCVLMVYGCGKSTVQQSRVIGGTSAAPSAWPWQVAMYLNGQFLCGGTLVNPNTVITAAHCTDRMFYGDFEVHAGITDRYRDYANLQKFRVKQVHQHPGYNRPSMMNNDISILKLDKPAVFNDHVQPACLPNSGEAPKPGTECYLTGWGKTSHPGSAVGSLRQVKLKVQSQSACRHGNSAAEAAGIKFTDQMLCAGYGPNDRRSGCHGDSGGPFVCQRGNGEWVLQGDMSWGSPRCNTKDAYSVFARTTKFLGWINRYL